MDYQKLYSNLFNGITDTIEHLQELQKQAEEDYLKMSDETGEKIVKFNVVKSKTDISMLSVSDEEYNKLLANLYTAEWQKPVKGLLDEAVMKNINATAVQYTGDRFADVVLFVSNKSTNGKHLISIMPVGVKDKLSVTEHFAILESFENAHKNIKFIRH